MWIHLSLLTGQEKTEQKTATHKDLQSLINLDPNFNQAGKFQYQLYLKEFSPCLGLDKHFSKCLTPALSLNSCISASL